MNFYRKESAWARRKTRVEFRCAEAATLREINRLANSAVIEGDDDPLDEDILFPPDPRTEGRETW